MHLRIFLSFFLVLIKRYFCEYIFGIVCSDRIITMNEVKEHKDDRWIIIDDDVYCLTSLTSHSGGLDIIKELSGRDVTRIFYEVHLKSNIFKEILNRKYWIGKINNITEKEESNYFLKEKLIYRTLSDSNISMRISSNEENIMKEHFKQHIINENFPCLGAKIAFRRNTFCFGYYDILGSKDTTKLLWNDLINFINCQSSFWENNHMFTTYVACFRTPKDINEIIFEKLLWKQLQLIHIEDVENGMKWVENYSDNPIDQNFGFSVGERAFFIVGLNPNSSRKSRQFITPTITFNSLDQFTNLRKLKMFNNLSQVIRNNDLRQNKSINPNLISNEHNSDALEYSGKLIQSNWIPKFISLHKKII